MTTASAHSTTVTRPVVTIARTVDEIAELRDAWESLQGDAVTTHPDHYLTVLTSDPRFVAPYVVLLEQDGTPEAMIVGRIAELGIACKFGYKTVMRPRLRALQVVYGGVLGSRADEHAELLVDELRGALDRAEADVVYLPNFRVDSRFAAVARTRPSYLSRHHVSEENLHWRVPIPSSMDEFMRSQSKHARQRLRYYGNRVERELGDDLAIEVFHDVADIDLFFERVGEVAAKTYQHGLGVAVRDDELHRNLTRLSMERGWFRAYVLTLQDRPVAFWYGSGYRGVFTTATTGYDPAYTDLRIGTYVLMKLIEDLCGDPAVSVLDFGFGDADYKRRFGQESWPETDIFIFARRPRPIAVNLGRSAIVAAGDAAARVVGRAGLTDRLKKGWRRHVRTDQESSSSRSPGT
jgi:CelD/BcsL family acetyltransferase involved in cellulose biosynthesis